MSLHPDIASQVRREGYELVPFQHFWQLVGYMRFSRDTSLTRFLDEMIGGVPDDPRQHSDPRYRNGKTGL